MLFVCLCVWDVVSNTRDRPKEVCGAQICHCRSRGGAASKSILFLIDFAFYFALDPNPAVFPRTRPGRAP